MFIRHRRHRSGAQIRRTRNGPPTTYESGDRWPLFVSTRRSVVTARELIVVQYYCVFTSDEQLLINLFIGNNLSKFVMALIELISAFNKKVVRTQGELSNVWQHWFLYYTMMSCFLHIWRVNYRPFVSRRQTFNFSQILTNKISRILEFNHQVCVSPSPYFFGIVFFFVLFPLDIRILIQI